MHKYTDDTAMVGSIRSGEEDEYRKLIQGLNNTTREMVVDLRRPRPHPGPVTIKGDSVEFVLMSKYLGVQLDIKDWRNQD